MMTNSGLLFHDNGWRSVLLCCISRLSNSSRVSSPIAPRNDFYVYFSEIQCFSIHLRRFQFPLSINKNRTFPLPFTPLFPKTSVPLQSNSSRTFPECSRASQVIHVHQIHTGIVQRSPNRIPRPNRPTRRIPEPRSDALGMRDFQDGVQGGLLGIVEGFVPHVTEQGNKVGTRDGGFESGDVALRRVQQGEIGVEEGVAGVGGAGGLGLDGGERRVACADHGNGFVDESGPVIGGEVLCV
jgi:hypothetical protein